MGFRLAGLGFRAWSYKLRFGFAATGSGIRA